MNDDAPLTIKEASEVFRLSVETLLSEWRKGNLELTKFGGRYYTSIAKLKAMEAKCRVEPPRRACGPIKSAEPTPSSMDVPGTAQASLLVKLTELKSTLANTSQASTLSATPRPRRLPIYFQPTQRNTSRTK